MLQETIPSIVQSNAHKPEAPLSIVKMSADELKGYTAQLTEYLNSDSGSGLRICECCINIS